MKVMQKHIVYALIGLGALGPLAGQGQTGDATHICAGYRSPGTIEIQCQSNYSATPTLYTYMWIMTLPAGWSVSGVTGGGFSSWEIFDYEGAWYLSPNGLPTQNPIAFTVSVTVPAGETGTKEIPAQAAFWFGGLPSEIIVNAEPDPLTLQRLCDLQVICHCGTPSPAVGLHTNVYGTVLNPSVEATASSGPTQYVCTGWSLTGQEPAVGTGTSFTLTHTADAVLTWNWSVVNINPTVEEGLTMTGYRTRPNVMTEADLLAHVSDPDGDAVILVSVDATSAFGGTVLRSNGVLTYTPPKHTDSVLDTFTFTVEDGKGGHTQGVVSIKVYYGAVAIRVF